MSPDPERGFLFTRGQDGNTRKTPLEKGSDEFGPYFIVPRNTLSYIKLRQELRIPYYFIGRHNLKISYVYQGLLLGTGPQVDPGYVGNLYIPLHNLTTRDVHVHINRSFVSIDFVRTTPMEFATVPASLESLYKEHERSKHLLELSKVNERRELQDYLRDATPQSAMGAVREEFSETRGQVEVFENTIRAQTKSLADEQRRELGAFREQLERRNRFDILAVAALAVTLVGLAIGGVALVRDFDGERASQMAGIQNQAATLERELGELKGRADEVRTAGQLETRLKQLEDQVSRLSAQAGSPRRGEAKNVR